MSLTLEQFRDFFAQRMHVGGESHFKTLGLTNVTIDQGKATVEMPYQESLIGHPGNGVMADGAMIALLDSCCALAAATVQEKIAFCPTLDLRVDHMGMAVAGQPLTATSEVYRHTNTVIFTRGTIYQDDPERPIMRALVNFTPIAHTIMNTDSDKTDGQARSAVAKGSAQ